MLDEPSTNRARAERKSNRSARVSNVEIICTECLCGHKKRNVFEVIKKR